MFGCFLRSAAVLCPKGKVPDPMIVICHVQHTYPGTRHRPPHPVLHDVTVTIEQGEFCLLSGPNGSGKSTLFRLLCGLAPPSSGTIHIGGYDLATDLSGARSLVGVVFQDPALDKQLSIDENLRLQARLYGLDCRTYESRRDHFLEWTRLRSRLHEPVETLSGGLARQVELVKCLLTHPRIILLDEPTSGLDPSSRRAFLEMLQQIRNDFGITILMTSHIFSDADYADRVAILNRGRIIAHDTPKSLQAILGASLVVVRPRDAKHFTHVLEREFSCTPSLHGEDLKIHDMPPGKAIPFVTRILERYNEHIVSIGVRQPELEDVFLHLTHHPRPASSPAAAPPASQTPHRQTEAVS